jgi:hypothetical protein
MTVYCAWRGKYMHTIDGKGQTGASHGMCYKCYRRQTDSLDRLAKEVEKATIKRGLLHRIMVKVGDSKNANSNKE